MRVYQVNTSKLPTNNIKAIASENDGINSQRTVFIIQSDDEDSGDILPRKKRKLSSTYELLLAKILDKLNKNDVMEDKIVETLLDNTKLLQIQNQVLRGYLDSNCRLQSENEDFMQKVEKTMDADFQIIKISRNIFEKLLQQFENTYTLKLQEPNALKPISPKHILFITVMYLTENVSVGKLSKQFGLRIFLTKRLLECGIQFICSLSSEVMKWLETDQFTLIEKEFFKISKFPRTIGAIGGCQLSVHSSDDSAKSSVLFIAVCDPFERFMFVCADPQSSKYQQDMFSKSALAQKLQYNPKAIFPSEKYHMVGNSSFPLDMHLMTPYPISKRLSSNERTFNLCLSKTRKIIDNAISSLREKFKRIDYIEAGVSTAPKLILACCILHNLIICRESEYIEINSMKSVQEDIYLVPDSPAAKRDHIAKYLLNFKT